MGASKGRNEGGRERMLEEVREGAEGRANEGGRDSVS